ncbi:DNA helicase-2 / ATP-dependent DNA helicase PcrA [Desulfonatronum thiosulfatophilum]|uniref:DNA 3'-5' helicase n=1 Tax=Desulfonatronum thiosulfatophilum TaxID=617002 RepID=A0A1G6B9N1_9BACT|nr:ATP-dependent helicase [Desulfonatronum thiosulfatophilum]SDB17314.1 DNA helicase-2 / ATP-dependent DNA helicase PcrA [Desulfonatronum thiosulfatophilum]
MSIDFEKQLNPAQWQAVRAAHGPLLVIAGAGSGKTRTIAYRLAYLVRNGVAPENILLLTFTRKAAQEMLFRASSLIGQELGGVAGGTFHSFAGSILRRYASVLGYPDRFTIMDGPDMSEILGQVRAELGVGKGDKAFPKKKTILGLISKSRNKEVDLAMLLERESPHMLHYGDDMIRIARTYAEFKLRHGLMDYDDLLFNLERLLLERDDLAEFLRMRHSHVMVDEFQDTNKVQARLVRQLAGDGRGVMAVGDDAQSIYAFRGAEVRNILAFPDTFPNTTIVRLEENYRSVQPILELTNALLRNATTKFDKNLFSRRTDGLKPQLINTVSDQTQAKVVVDKILELSRSCRLRDIAVLFRAGYQSYPVEMLLNKIGLRFRKYGGLKFTDAAHVKDVLAYLRLIVNPADLPAWQRAVSHVKGMGPKTCNTFCQALLEGEQQKIARTTKKFPDVAAAFDLINALRHEKPAPTSALQRILEFYTPLFQDRYPDDYPRRQAGLDQLLQIASGFTDLDAFLAELTLESPEESREEDCDVEDHVVLSTVHSAKGLEWSAVLVIDLVNGRFPSRHAMENSEDLEEERRLLYVACTRARDYLGLFVPSSVYNRFMGGSEPALPSLFVSELPPSCYEELRENYLGQVKPRTPLPAREPRPFCNNPDTPSHSAPLPSPGAARHRNNTFGHCRHKIFGRGKIVEFLPPNRYRINFPGFGLKIIMVDFLSMEE